MVVLRIMLLYILKMIQKSNIQFLNLKLYLSLSLFRIFWSGTRNRIMVGGSTLTRELLLVIPIKSMEDCIK